MFYREFPPRPALANFLRCIWAFESLAENGAAEMQRIVPDGHPELILHFGDRFHEINDGNMVLQSRMIFAGQISRPLLLQPGACAGVIGVRFRPAGARALLGVSMAEHTDARLDIAELWPGESESLLDEVHCATDVTMRVGAVERYLLQRLTKSRIGPDAAISHCVAALQRADGHISVDTLALDCHLSSRQLERRFLHEVGIPPRLLASIIRFRRVFDLLEQPNRWVDAALSAGYFDQAHMIRDFKRFAGQQPRAFYRGLHQEPVGLSAAMVGGGLPAT